MDVDEGTEYVRGEIEGLREPSCKEGEAPNRLEGEERGGVGECEGGVGV